MNIVTTSLSLTLTGVEAQELFDEIEALELDRDVCPRIGDLYDLLEARD